MGQRRSKGLWQERVRRMRRLGVALIAFFVVSLGWTGHATAAEEAQRDLTEVSLEELLDVKVFSVSKRAESRLTAAAAVYVITQDDIRRSGVTSIPEALRLAPGVHVARVNSNQWAIGIRGFTSRLSRAVLVLIDGRSIYSPLFAGVFWEVQDTLLEDVDRIEVIRGPGATLWGANAFSGVINIITRTAKETQGVLVTGGGGTEERAFGAFRYGGALDHGLNYRVYGKFFDRDAGFHQGTGDFDAWHMGQAGFRADWAAGEADSLTLQGDVYEGRAGERTAIASFSAPFSETVEDDTALSGGNVLGRWRHAFGSTSEARLRMYYDRTNRRQVSFEERRDTFDLDLNHNFRLRRQEIIWGVGYRVTSGETDGVPTVQFVPSRRTDDLFSAFVQDDVTLVANRLRLTLGSKFEHNEYSGFEVQPSGRLVWTPHARHAVWASVARAVRTPSRVEHDLSLTSLVEPATPTFVRLTGDERFDSEQLLAYELGYRIHPTEEVFVDIALFYNRFTDLFSLEPGTPFLEPSPPPGHLVVPVFIGNGLGGEAYGVEVASDWRPFGWWRLAGAYSYLQLDLKPDAGSLDSTSEEAAEGSSPRHQVSLRSFMDLARQLELDLVLRYVSRLSSQDVGDYVGLDAGVTWHPVRSLDISVVGQNLLERRHPEFRSGDTITEVERGVYGKATWRW